MNIQNYLAAIVAVESIGGEIASIVDAIKSHAQANLSPDEYDQLIAAWDADAQEAARNAGLGSDTAGS